MMFLSLFILVSDTPVIELDDMLLKGTVRRPPTIEIQGSNLKARLEQEALKNLIALEKELLQPEDYETYKNRHSAPTAR